MRPRDRELAASIANGLHEFQRQAPLPGLKSEAYTDCLVEQIVESVRRVRFVRSIPQRPISPQRMDPTSDIFDPLRASILRNSAGDVDEAFWLVFIATHFGKHHQDGWRLARDIYGALGTRPPWTWPEISREPAKFRTWLQTYYTELCRSDVPRRFGNHRKYETLNPSSPLGTAAVFESYVNWVSPYKTHLGLIRGAEAAVGDSPEKLFAFLFESLSSVIRFGRTGRFDYLCYLGNLGIVNIVPDLAYITNATGPRRGALLLFGGSTKASIPAKELELLLAKLDAKLGVGKQVLEDALCNWQKSPDVFRPFRG